MLLKFIGTVIVAGKLLQPTVVDQVAGPEGGRIIEVKNPIRDIVWVKFECENVLSKDWISLPPRSTTKVDLRAEEPIVGGPCLIWQWRAQGDKHSID